VAGKGGFLQMAGQIHSEIPGKASIHKELFQVGMVGCWDGRANWILATSKKVWNPEKNVPHLKFGTI
jgi:hypothetical protein